VAPRPEQTTRGTVGGARYGAAQEGVRRTVEVTGDVEATMVTAGTGPAAAPDWLDELERVWQELEPPEGSRAELIDGEIVVSPSGSIRHSTAIDRLMDQLFELKRRHGWVFHTYLTAHIRPTRERLIPDLMVAPEDAPHFSDNELLASGVLLVAEVVSPWSRRRDRDVKRRAYARSGVPLYLLIDHLADPPAVTLHSEPGQDNYARTQRATSGQPLRLPEPFGVDLDTARLLA
jgi:Uma2 family endonuclease